MEPLDSLNRWSDRLRDRARAGSFGRFVLKRFLGDRLFEAAGALAPLLFASVALMLVLGRVMDLDLAALLVALIWAVVAAVLAVTGRRQLKSFDPQLSKTTQTLKEDVQWAKTLTD